MAIPHSANDQAYGFRIPENMNRFFRLFVMFKDELMRGILLDLVKKDGK